METDRRPLWTCPKCWAKLVTRNLWHSCGRARCGTYHVSPAKIRIAFRGRVRFAGITRLTGEGMTCSFALPKPLRSPRLVRIEEVAPGWWSHRLQVAEPRQLDSELQSWLRESYRLMGMQGRLEKKLDR